MNRYEVRYRPDGKWWNYTIYRNGQPLQGDILRTRRAAVKQAQIELQKLQRAEQQPLAA
jgi:hypothetical protein